MSRTYTDRAIATATLFVMAITVPPRLLWNRVCRHVGARAVAPCKLAIGRWWPSQQRMEMTMSTATKANAELESRPLEAHELDIVSGSGIPVQQKAVFYGGWFTPTYGPFAAELYIRVVKGLG